jgi:predicted  nucleic acid-binding Zn-ribbon protein
VRGTPSAQAYNVQLSLEKIDTFGESFYESLAAISADIAAIRLDARNEKESELVATKKELSDERNQTNVLKLELAEVNIKQGLLQTVLAATKKELAKERAQKEKLQFQLADEYDKHKVQQMELDAAKEELASARYQMKELQKRMGEVLNAFT